VNAFFGSWRQALGPIGANIRAGMFARVPGMPAAITAMAERSNGLQRALADLAVLAAIGQLHALREDLGRWRDQHPWSCVKFITRLIALIGIV
jgi:hypothetical protein